MTQTTIKVNQLIYDYPGVRALGGVSLEVNGGEIFALVGPDGAGKTTLIKILATILKPTGGSVSINGQDSVRFKKDVKKVIGYMSQKFSLYEDLTVLENLTFFAELYDLPQAKRKSTLERLLSFANLEGFTDFLAGQLSGGMKQKLALACTLVKSPQILLLDEPTTGVDPLSRRELWAILSELHRQGTTIFLSTPYLDEAERSNKVAFLDRGKIKLIDQPEAIKQSLKGIIIEIFGRPFKELIRIVSYFSTVKEFEVFGDRVEILVDSLESFQEIEKALKEKLTAYSFRPKKPSLEQVFSYLRESEER